MEETSGVLQLQRGFVWFRNLEIIWYDHVRNEIVLQRAI